MTTDQKSSSGRVVSIDALRGFDMFWIVGGTAFFTDLFDWTGSPFLQSLNHQMEHTDWNGFTAYDLIFPLFLFIVGASLPFAISRRIEQGADRMKLWLHVVRRTVTLLFLALIYAGLLDFDFSRFRYAGVLQRIALCYFIAGTITLSLGIRGQALFAAINLLAYWAMMALVPVPEIGAGILTPKGNLAGYIDRLLLPGEFCCYTFGDNEGILSTLPAISTTLLGVLSGHWLRTNYTGSMKTLGLAGAGVICLLLALLWNPVFPINKLMWSSSYVLFAGGWSLLLLALFYWVIDVQGYQRWAILFVVIGMNAITIYVANRLFDFSSISSIFIHGFSDSLGSFKEVFENFCELAVKWLFLYFLYCKKIFLKA
jgi:predicted acyltransferase